ncbi:MAG: hypothetical protein J6I85_09335 [Clostridia bacterium]|nr:hypothetical protein [Clostridia bacterium]
MKKTIASILVIIMLLAGLLLLTGCGEQNTTSTENPVQAQEEKKEESGKNNKAYELIEKLEPTNTIEEANKIVGTDATLTDEKYYIYEYDFGGDYKITLKYYSATGKTADIKLSYNKNDLKDSRVTLKNASDLKSKIQGGEKVSYDDFKEAVGGVDGTLTEKTKYTKNYVWVNEKGGYISATFSTRDNTCSYFAYTN